MILGMSLSTFTAFHVIISLIAIVSGLVVMFGLLGSNRRPSLTATFLVFTILTSATGFLFPFEKLLPSHMIGIVSLLLLGIACVALYVMKLSGAWRWTYVLTALIALYLNVFVLIIQSFLKIAPLHALARACLRANRRSRLSRASYLYSSRSWSSARSGDFVRRLRWPDTRSYVSIFSGCG